MAPLPIRAILAIDIMTALLAIRPLLFIDLPQTDAAAARQGGWRSVIQMRGEGSRYLWTWRGLCIALASVSLMPFFQQPAWSLVPLLVRDHSYIVDQLSQAPSLLTARRTLKS